jgi:hypothetical protein
MLGAIISVMVGVGFIIAMVSGGRYPKAMGGCLVAVGILFVLFVVFVAGVIGLAGAL